MLSEEKSLPAPEIYIMWLFIFFLLGYFLKSPTLAAESARSALKICAAGLIPSLFPFIVLVNMMSSSGLSEKISHIIGKPLAFIFGLPNNCAYAIILGALGGFPVGAVCTRELYESEKIDKSTAERLITFTNNASPAFCIGTIGMTLFSDVGYGVKLYFCQLAAAFFVGSLQRKKVPPLQKQEIAKPVQNVANILTGAVEKAGLVMLKICSFAVFFAVVGDALCIVTEHFFGDYASALTASLVELTLAGRRCALLDSYSAQILCAFAVGWSGFSVHMQCTAMLLGSDISMKRYYVSKFCQGIICSLLIFISG